MAQEEYGKLAALILTAILVAVYFCAPVDCSVVGLTKQGGWPRLYYSFLHASVLHLVVNCWCLLSIAFAYTIKPWQLVLAIVTATLTPAFCLYDTPTVGLSVAVYALLGMWALHVRRKLFYSAWILSYLSIGFLFPAVNVLAHIYGYMAGLLVSLLTMPMKCETR